MSIPILSAPPESQPYQPSKPGKDQKLRQFRSGSSSGGRVSQHTSIKLSLPLGLPGGIQNQRTSTHQGTR